MCFFVKLAENLREGALKFSATNRNSLVLYDALAKAEDYFHACKSTKRCANDRKLFAPVIVSMLLVERLYPERKKTCRKVGLLYVPLNDCPEVVELVNRRIGNVQALSFVELQAFIHFCTQKVDAIAPKKSRIWNKFINELWTITTDLAKG